MVRHRNNIGLIRLILAALVIIGHAPEMIDGNVTREPLARLMPSMTLGGLAVDGFFLLSGYLITISMMRSRSPVHFLERRILRIYPAFIVAFFAAVFVLGPIADANPFEHLPEAMIRLVLLHEPGTYTGVFPGLVIYPELNAALWTIFHEFRCYILLLVLGVTGLLLRRKTILVLTLVTCLAFLVELLFPVQGWPAGKFVKKALTFLVGPPDQLIRLTAIFLIGCCIALYREEVIPRLSGWTAVICGVGAVVLALSNSSTAELALITLGAIPLFWLALRAGLGPLQRINDRWDISYGVYLYGWPIATYLRWAHPGIDPWTLAAVTLGFACIAGTLSWHLVERPTKDLRIVDRIGFGRAGLKTGI